MTAKSRIAALNRSVIRRLKLDEQLREQLTARRTEHAQLVKQSQDQLARVQVEQATLHSYEQKVNTLTNGTQAFSLNDFNDYRLCIGIAAERVGTESAKLDELESHLSTAASAISETQHEIAQNNARIDTCRERVSAIKRELEIADENATDEEAEELAAARIVRTKAR
jgi:type III secretion system HrpB7-like protein